jgi:hypothetical protein
MTVADRKQRRGSLTQVLVKVLNLNVRSMATPLLVSVHLPPFVDSKGVRLCLRASTSAPFEKTGSILPVAYRRVIVREMGRMAGNLSLGDMFIALMF